MVISSLRRPDSPESAINDEKFWTGVADNTPDEVDDEDGFLSVDRLYEALDKLSPDERTLITLFYLDGKSLSEIAFIMSLSETNAKTRLFRIRKKLHKIISDGIRQQ